MAIHQHTALSFLLRIFGGTLNIFVRNPIFRQTNAKTGECGALNAQCCLDRYSNPIPGSIRNQDVETRSRHRSNEDCTETLGVRDTKLPQESLFGRRLSNGNRCDIITQQETKFLRHTLRRGTERKGWRREGKSSMTWETAG
ncbi:hypothetical protein AVEN_113505-1 [Araneus ventricosus]|uniref:Uncharacterized protein n=1 Tax=Araneus ventricosus TaxID=182803 RepID=A0A4Y2IB12_ARAVE|nr:hypothetical protein AVEN_113505-1 [Araneus ventricosus]